MTVVAATPSLLRGPISSDVDRSVVKVHRLALLGSVHMASHVVATWVVRNLTAIDEDSKVDQEVRLGEKFPTQTCEFRDDIARYIQGRFDMDPAREELLFEFKQAYEYPSARALKNNAYWGLWDLAYELRLEHEINWPSGIALKVTRRNGHVAVVLLPKGLNSTESKTLYEANLLNG